MTWIAAARNPQHSYLDEEAVGDDEKPKVSEGFRSLSCWVTMIAFAAFSLGTAAVMNFEPLYMVQAMGMDQAAANGMLNISNITVVIAGIAIGFVMNIVKSTTGRMGILVAGAALQGVTFGLAYVIGESMLVPWLILFGLANGVVPAIFFTLVAEIAPRPQLASVSSTLMSLGQSVGGILFGVVGGIVTTAGWGASAGLLSGAGAVMFLGALALMFILRSRERKRSANE